LEGGAIKYSCIAWSEKSLKNTLVLQGNPNKPFLLMRQYYHWCFLPLLLHLSLQSGVGCQWQRPGQTKLHLTLIPVLGKSFAEIRLWSGWDAWQSVEPLAKMAIVFWVKVAIVLQIKMAIAFQVKMVIVFRVKMLILFRAKMAIAFRVLNDNFLSG